MNVSFTNIYTVISKVLEVADILDYQAISD